MALAVVFTIIAYLTVANELTRITANKIEESARIISAITGQHAPSLTTSDTNL